jgi:hypothetical protein
VPLAAGTVLGPYEVRAALGSGGMGEVYRALDRRLDREVALKVIASEHASNPERIDRFQKEARAVASLAHPHILALHDLGSDNGTFYVVFELLEGTTLRHRLDEGPLPVRRAVELASQICRGLAAAHVRNIVHRDLKPENLFLTREGQVKILDFGVAKLVRADGDGPAAPNSQAATAPGLLVGTVGYMSPEQARGEPVDARSDLFAVGALLYEMVTGRRPFDASSGADTLAALLTREPAEMGDASRPVPPALQEIVRRCLQKDRDERFQSARDLAFALEALVGLSTGSGIVAGIAAAPPPSARKRTLRAGLVLLGLLAAAALGFLVARRVLVHPAPSFKQLTFRRGWSNFARFSPDGRTVLYTAAWNGEAPEIYATRTDNREARPLGLRHAALLSVSSQGQMAILLDPHRGRGLFTRGTLATVPLGGGQPREVLEDVAEADWLPDGSELCVLRVVAGEHQLELPLGNVLYRSSRGLRLLRVSPDGRHAALVEGTESQLSLVLVSVAEKRARVILPGLAANLFGLAWAPGGREIWFSMGETQAHRDIVAVDLEGRRRLVYRPMVAASLLDLSADGRALMHRGTDRWGTQVRVAGAEAEQDVSIFDGSVPPAISMDGRTLLIDEFSEAAGPGGAVYIRRLAEDKPAVPISDGLGWDISADGRTALVKRGDPAQIFAVPTGTGLVKPIPLGGITPRWGKWVPPDAARLVVLGSEGDRPLRLFILNRDGTGARAIGPESGATFFAVATDGRHVAARTAPGVVSLLSTGEEPVREIRGIPDDFVVGSFGGDGRSLFLVRTSATFPCEVHRFDLVTETLEPWMRVSPSDATGISQCAWMNLAADGKTYAYGYFQALGDLFVAEGFR